ncbi:MAG: hypothetical protein KDN22_26200 [Verrucomicrobiae bacterium]|nr:hypothetical protein [Verrucomicrobiae bacterium]
MTIVELAVLSIEACEAEGIDHMLTGAFATSCYGIPRSDDDFVQLQFERRVKFWSEH